MSDNGRGVPRIIWPLLSVLGLAIVLSAYKVLDDVNFFQIAALSTGTCMIGHIICHRVFPQDAPPVSSVSAKSWIVMILVGFASEFVYVTNALMTRNGGNVSIAFPALMAGIIFFSVAAGLLFFREPLSRKKAAGLAMIMAGVLLLYA